MFVNGCVSRKKWRLHDIRESARLRTAVLALMYDEGDPLVIPVESRGQPLQWRKTVSTHALTGHLFPFVPGRAWDPCRYTTCTGYLSVTS